MAAVDPPGAPPWVYQQPAAIVISQINAMSSRADTALEASYRTIEALSQISLGGESGAPPDMPFPAIPGTDIDRPDAPDIREFGSIDGFITPPFDMPDSLLSQFDSVLNSLPLPGDWVPPITSLAIPTPPAPIDTSGMPTRPSLLDVAIPAEPEYQIPLLDQLLQINLPPVPALDFPDYEDFDVVFQGSPVNTILQWAEPEYVPLVLDEVAAAIKAMLAGDFVMTAVVEAMLFDRDRARGDTVALKSVDEAFETWAGRGFPLPSGMLVAQVNAVQDQNKLDANARAREVLTKSADWAIDNLRTAIGTGIQLETVLIAQFNNAAQRVFDAARARLDADVQMFGQYVSLYNAGQAARQVQVAILNSRLQAVVTRLEAWKTQLEGERIKGQLNETTARIFATKVDAVGKIVDIYKARMEGARIKSDINKNIIDGFKADIDAYAARLQADKVRFDAYDSQMKGVEAQARVIEASARAFAATVEAESSIGNVKIQAIRGKVDVMNLATGRFSALTEAERAKLGAQAQAISSRAQAFSADCTRYAAELQANTEEARLGVTISESRLRNMLAYYETRVREYDQSMTRLIERGRVVVSALSAAGGMASQLAAGAMSAMHVQASLSGSGNAGTSWSNSYSYSENHNFDEE